MHLGDLISQPMSVMRDICDYVDVECSVDYIHGNLCRQAVPKVVKYEESSDGDTGADRPSCTKDEALF